MLHLFRVFVVIYNYCQKLKPLDSMNDNVDKRNKGIRHFFLMTGCLLLMAASPTVMAQEPDAPIDEYKKKAQDISREIEKGRAEIQKFTHKESDIIQQLNQADRALNRSRKRAANIGREIDRLDKTNTGQ